MNGLHDFDLLTVADVAELLHCSKAHVCNAIAARVQGCAAIPAVSLGRRKLVRDAHALYGRPVSRPGIIALVALAVVALAGNQNAGSGRTVTRGEQMFLLLVAALLSATQTIAYLIEIRRTRQVVEAGATEEQPPRRARKTDCLGQDYEF